MPRARPREMKTVQLEWRRFTRVVMGLFGFLLAAMILRQQLEMGIHRQLWADPVQRLFLDLGGLADWVEITVEGEPLRGPATLAELKEHGTAVARALGLDPEALTVESEARSLIGSVGLRGVLGHGERILVLAQAVSPQAWGAGPEPETNLIIQWTSRRLPDDLLYRRRRLARPLRQGNSRLRRFFVGMSPLARERVSISGQTSSSLEVVLARLDGALEKVGAKRLSPLAAGRIAAHCPLAPPGDGEANLFIELAPSDQGTRLVVSSGRTM
ncbi:MAG: hypothetical protein ACOX20_01905 [Limnochordia bacterium]|nr:hypothetical protein [Bacillota bacterium]